MANLNKESIRKLSELSRIDCTEAEQEMLLKDLQSILGYFDQLQEIDTGDTPPCNNVLTGMANVFREDTVGKTLPREVFLSNAPAHTGGLVRVPPVIVKNTTSFEEEG